MSTEDTGRPGPPPVPTAESPSLLFLLNEALARPDRCVERISGGDTAPAARLLGAALFATVCYGAVAGSFQGGEQIFHAAWKAPLVLLGSLLICGPSLFVLGAVAGVEWTWPRLAATASGFASTLGVLLAGLLPIAWLFSVSSRSLGFITMMHFLGWALCIAFGWRLLSQALRLFGGAGALFLWLLLFFVVSLQMATLMRPLLWREPGTPVLARERLFFLEHFGQLLDPPTPASPPAVGGGTAKPRGCEP